MRIIAENKCNEKKIYPKVGYASGTKQGESPVRETEQVIPERPMTNFFPISDFSFPTFRLSDFFGPFSGSSDGLLFRGRVARRLARSIVTMNVACTRLSQHSLSDFPSFRLSDILFPTFRLYLSDFLTFRLSYFSFPAFRLYLSKFPSFRVSDFSFQAFRLSDFLTSSFRLSD
jgi:hypothetical protein